MQMTGPTKFLYKNCSHGQKHKIRIFERPLPSNSPEIVLHTFSHSTLIAPWFQEDLRFWSAEQLEPDKSMLKIRGKHKSQSWGKANSRRPSPPLTQIWPHSKIQTCLQVTWQSFTLWHWHVALLPSRLHHQETTSELSYKLVILLFSGLSIAHTHKKR